MRQRSPKSVDQRLFFSTGIDNDVFTHWHMLKATAKTLLGWHLATTRLKNDLIFQICFLGATKHLYNWLCPLVGWLVCGVTHSSDDPHVAPY